MPISSPNSVVVIGAGPVGLICALFLAHADIAVCVIDSGARGAGWASGGMLGAVYETLDDASSPLLRSLAQISLPLWHALAQDLSIPLSGPTLFVARNTAETDHLRAHLDATYPAVPLPQGLVGQAAWRCETDVALDPRASLVALRHACEAAGVAFEQGEVVRIAPEAVHLRDGRALAARKIVVATGQGGAGLQESVPELGCITPVKGQLLRLAGAAAVLDAKIVRAGRIYLIARGGDVIVGATSGGGQDATHIHVDDQLTLYHEACQLVSALQAFWPSESWAGLRPMTPDALPLLGETMDTGAILACGTYRNGWLLAPVLAKAVVGVVEGDTAIQADLLAQLSPSRFPIAPRRAMSGQ